MNETVRFYVSYTYQDSAGTEFLDQYQNYSSGFVVLIWSSNLSNFQGDPQSSYLNHMIDVKGTIQSYGGYYEIIVTDPSQISIVG